MNLHARCHDGERCENLIEKALTLTNVTYNDGSERGGIYENLWDAHPPFQIDGNFGVTSGMAEMLMQSYQGKIELLPALPTNVWKKGEVHGLRAINGFGIDISWEDGKATTVKISSDAGKTAIIKHPDASCCFDITDDGGNKIEYEIINDNEIRFPTTAGATYTLINNGQTNISRYEGIIDGDYYIALPGESTMFLRQISAKSGHLELTEDNDQDGTIWTFIAHDANEYPTYSSYQAWLKEGKVYYLNNKDFNYGLRNLFIRSNVVNALSLHPVYIHRLSKLLAIRATNIDSQLNNYNNWYGIEDGNLSAKLTEPACCWQLQPAPVNAIYTPSNSNQIIKTEYITIDGIHYTIPNKKGIYIRQEQRSDGSVKQRKTIVQ